MAWLIGMCGAAEAADSIPSCRLDDRQQSAVTDVLTRSMRIFAALGKALPFDRVMVNPRSAEASEQALRVYIVRDGKQGATTREGCIQGAGKPDAEPDSLSVRGGCVVVATERAEIRCSSQAVAVFAGGAQRSTAHPALLYVLAHELGHIYQRRSGEYAGRIATLSLAAPQATKIDELRAGCEPADIRREEDADAIALAVMQEVLAEPPYRQTVLSERGSMYWNIDLMALAADGWQKLSMESEIGQRGLHAAFVPTEFPTPPDTVTRNARRFVCDALTKQKGVLRYPARSASHPAMEQRLRRIAEALKPVADRLPDTGGHKDFQPIARLQGDVSPIFAFMYRESGIYFESVQRQICEIVNAPDPAKGCR